MKKLLALLAMSAATLTHAAPVAYDFEYTLAGGSVLAGTLIGELQGDANTVLVDSIADFVTFNGIAGPSLPVVDSVSNFFGGSGAPAVVSLDGSVIDLIACIDATCSDGFLFEGPGTTLGSPIFFGGASFGPATEGYAPGRWSLEAQVTAVPEPSALALAGLALLIAATVGSQRRSRSR